MKPKRNYQVSTGLKLAQSDIDRFRALARYRSARTGTRVTPHSLLRRVALHYLKRHAREVREAIAQGGEG